MPDQTNPEDIVWSVTRRDLEDRAGRRLTEYELSDLAEAIGNSSVPDALDEVVAWVVGYDDESDDP